MVIPDGAQTVTNRDGVERLTPGLDHQTHVVNFLATACE